MPVPSSRQSIKAVVPVMAVVSKTTRERAGYIQKNLMIRDTMRAFLTGYFWHDLWPGQDQQLVGIYSMYIVPKKQLSKEGVEILGVSDYFVAEDKVTPCRYNLTELTCLAQHGALRLRIRSRATEASRSYFSYPSN
jgi:hypothetical protein